MALSALQKLSSFFPMSLSITRVFLVLSPFEEALDIKHIEDIMEFQDKRE